MGPTVSIMVLQRDLYSNGLLSGKLKISYKMFSWLGGVGKSLEKLLVMLQEGYDMIALSTD